MDGSYERRVAGSKPAVPTQTTWPGCHDRSSHSTPVSRRPAAAATRPRSGRIRLRFTHTKAIAWLLSPVIRVRCRRTTGRSRSRYKDWLWPPQPHRRASRLASRARRAAQTIPSRSRPVAAAFGRSAPGLIRHVDHQQGVSTGQRARAAQFADDSLLDRRRRHGSAPFRRGAGDLASGRHGACMVFAASAGRRQVGEVLT